MLLQLRHVLAASQRAVQCRLIGHTWTDMAYPPACSQCGRTQSAVELAGPGVPAAAPVIASTSAPEALAA